MLCPPERWPALSNRALTWAKKQTLGSPTRKLVLLVVADRVSDSDYSTFAGQDTLAAEAEVNIRTVRRVLTEFEDWGLIERSHRRRPDGMRTSDLIRLNLDWEPGQAATEPADTQSPDTESASCEQDIPDSDYRTHSHRTHSQGTLTTGLPDSHDRVTGHSVRAIEDEPSVEPSAEPSDTPARLEVVTRSRPPDRLRAGAEVRTLPVPTNGHNQRIPTGDYPADFEAWFSRYPKKKNKRDAFASWKRARGRTTWEQLIEGLERSIAMWEAEGTATRFIPQASAWLDGNRWEDEPDVQLNGNGTSGDAELFGGLERVLAQRAQRRSS